MRPVDKGAAPAVCIRYHEALVDLRNRLGDYCSYCERQIETHLAVEHIQPRASNPGLQNSWANLLLSCVNCNSCKGDKPVALFNYFWPDRDNTLRAIEYQKAGVVRPHTNLVAADRAKACNTITLTGLDKDLRNADCQPTISDLRWLKRQQTWQKAELYRARLAQRDNGDMRKAVVDLAVERGMFSIWWTVFAGDIDMRRRLREAFKGTHGASFDINENPIPRAGGQL